MEATTKTKYAKCDLFLGVFTAFFIFAIVVCGICARVVLDEYQSRIALIILILVLAVGGFILILVLYSRRRAAIKRMVAVTTRRNGGKVYKKAPNISEPSAPVEVSSWRYSNIRNNDDYSNRTTVLA